MTNLDELNEKFSFPDHVEIKQGPGGQAIVEVKNQRANAEIILQGAHLISWAPEGEEPVVWLSEDAKFAEGKSIRGGVPVCWPWFGPHETDASFPAHGFARTVPWTLTETQQLGEHSTRLVFSIEQSEATKATWPYDCELEMVFLIGQSLEIDLVTKNTGDEAFIIGEALHTYFAVSDAGKISIQGLDECTYLDKVDNYARKQQQGAITIDTEVDRVYLDTSTDCIIEDPGMNRCIRINKTGSRSTIVWNPWEEVANKMGDLGENGYLNMVCVESGNAVENLVTVQPGGQHHLSVKYDVGPLS